MRKILLFVLFMFAAGLFIRAGVLTEFDDNFKDPYVRLDNKNIYVLDKALLKICVYSRRDFHKIAQFGKKGQGAGEFYRGISSIYITNDAIGVNSFPKVCFFSKTGKFLREIKVSSNTGMFMPFGNNYIGLEYLHYRIKDKTAKIQFSLYDDDLEKEKNILLAEFRVPSRTGRKQPVLLFGRDCTKAAVYNERVYIGSTFRGFYFAVFDLEGNKLYDINRKYEKRKVKENEKQEKINAIKRSLGEQEWKRRQAIFDYKFSEYYPAYGGFAVDNDKIYVIDYPEGSRQPVTILDLKGNLLKKTSFPKIKAAGVLTLDRFFIRMGKIYYMKDNEDTENWELHMLKID